MTTTRDVAQAFSRHRFAEAYDALSDEVVWAVPGQTAIVGKAAVIEACEETISSLSEVDVAFLRFVAVADDQTAAVDAVARYTGPGDAVSVVSSADIYEFDRDRVVAITSYAVDLDASTLGPTSFIGAPG